MKFGVSTAAAIWFCLSLTPPLVAGVREQKPPRVPTERENAVAALLVEKLGQDAGTIQVVIQRDRAVLSGEVEERVTQELAAEVALSFEGIQAASNRVRARKAPTIPDGHLLREGMDAELERRVEKAIKRADPAAGKELRIEVADGVVAIRGRLDSAARHARAIATARGVAGVTGVLDLMRVGH